MKKALCILSALFLTAFVLQAQPETIHVSTSADFLNAIGSNRTIIIDADLYDMTDVLRQKPQLEVSYEKAATTGKKVFYVSEFDGPELHIANVQNLTISAGSDIIMFVTDPRYANVISFDRCSGVVIKGITFGHSEEGYCSQGVLGFTDCSDFRVDRCDLYGCGTEGICVAGCENMVFKATKIRDCSYHIMHLGNSSDILFLSCQFFRNREFEQVNISDCTYVEFDNCMFANNTGVLFNITCPVTMRDCVVLHDSDFWGNSEQIIFYNCITDEYFNQNQALGSL